MPVNHRFMQPIPVSELPPLLRFFASMTELAEAIGVTPQALYIRRRKKLPLVTAEEAALLLREKNIPLHISRPDIFPKLRRA